MMTTKLSYESALEALNRYAGAYRDKLDSSHIQTINEIAGRIDRLEDSVIRLIDLNNKFIENHRPRTEFNPETDTVTFFIPGSSEKLEIRLRRADPDVPISFNNLMHSGGYVSGPMGDQSQAENKDRKALETLLEDYYQNAHRVIKLVKTLPGLGGFKSLEITIVRNKLVEHPHTGELYSFGYGPTGPVVKPIHRRGREFHDDGLIPNTERFIERLTQAFARLANSARKG